MSSEMKNENLHTSSNNKLSNESFRNEIPVTQNSKLNQSNNIGVSLSNTLNFTL